MKQFPVFKIILGFAACFVISSQASAQFAASPCDPKYYESLEARAWLEAQREITQNQNLIFKPDSVLEYTCFDKQLREVAAHAEQMFSETQRWEEILPNTSMDTALQNLVSASIVAYDQANFAGSLLGGRVSVDGWGSAGKPKSATGPTYAPEATIAAAQPYACDVMQAVWMKAKCMDFIHASGEDGFFTFADYRASPDKRFLPSRCSTTPLAQWATDIDKSTGNATPWKNDDVETYLNKVFPPSGCGIKGDKKGTRIKTGMIVQTSDTALPEFYNEHACLVPGCHWAPSGSGSLASPSNNGKCVRQ